MLNFLFFFSFSALILGSVPLWWGLVRNKKATGQLIPTRAGAGSPLGFLDVIVMFFFWLLGQAVSLGLVTLIFGIRIEELASQSGDTKSWATIVMAAGQLAATFVAVAIFLIRYRKLSAVGFQPSHFRRDSLLGLAAFVMVIPAILFLQWLLVLVFDYEHPTMELLAKNANGLTLLATWFSAVIAAPICEEIFFRGVLQAWLQRLGGGSSDHVLTGGWDSTSKLSSETIPKKSIHKLATGSPGERPANPYQSPSDLDESSWTNDAFWPILVTSLFFALAHAGQGPAPIPLFFFGIALGYVFHRTGSVLPCIVLHMLLNAFSMFWFTLQVFWGDNKPAIPVEQLQGLIEMM